MLIDSKYHHKKKSPPCLRFSSQNHYTHKNNFNATYTTNTEFMLCANDGILLLLLAYCFTASRSFDGARGIKGTFCLSFSLPAFPCRPSLSFALSPAFLSKASPARSLFLFDGEKKRRNAPGVFRATELKI